MAKPGRRTLRIAALICALGAVLLLVSALRQGPGAAAASTAPAPPVTTPLYSPRRVPAIFRAAAEQAARGRARAAFEAELVSAAEPYRACVAVDVDGDPVARVNDTTTFAPASTLKVVTGSVALAELGANYRFTTRVVADDDDIVMIGGGDPLLATPQYIEAQHEQLEFRTAQYTPLTALADAIVASGVKSVTGAIVVDDSRDETLRYLPDWKPNYGADGEVGALGALTVDGGFSDPVGRTPAADPAVLAGRRLQQLLAARGVNVAGGVRRGTAPANAREIAHVDSPPLSTILQEMLQGSDNYTAEELLREIAVHVQPGVPGSTAAGLRVVQHELAALTGAPQPGTVMHDGSGLAPDDRVKCSTLLALIDRAKPGSPIAAALPVAGHSGTLAGRFIGDPLAGHLRAKTGTLDGVTGLVGMIDTGSHPTFALLASGSFGTSQAWDLQARVVHVIAAYRVPAPPADLVPAP